MLFNRVINGIIDWVRRLLYWRTASIKRKPYTVLELYPGKYGLLRLVARDTPRAVLTYIYTPKPTQKTNVVTGLYDYHICLDHLWAVDNPEMHVRPFMLNKKTKSFKLAPKASQFTRKRGEPTHSITTLKASRWLDGNGDYLTTVLYHENIDLIGKDTTAYRDKYASPVFKEVITNLKYKTFEEINWAEDIEEAQRRFMGSYYLAPINKDKQTISV